MSTPPTSPSSDSYSVIKNLPTLPTPVSNVPSDAVASITANSTNPPIICLLRFACDSAAGALRGSILGYGSGLIKKKGFKGSFSEAGSFAKRFVVLTGLHRLVVCFLKRLRGKDDVINAGVAGCCRGLALSYPGSPQALLQSCLGFGAFSVVIKGLNKRQFALALPDSAFGGKRRHFDVLPPLAIPLATELNESFWSFCETLRK